ncbi:MAG: nitroreductase family protein [Planctomycetes bacterium]|nr:nitroreductase family protein [Planctomycetota bacterium]
MDAPRSKTVAPEPLESERPSATPAAPLVLPNAGGIPALPASSPHLTAAAKDYDVGAPVGPTPAMDFWEALYGRRSVRKFKGEAVPRELIDQVMHAGIWAPSSCNYQMWDLVAVDDPTVNAKLAALSSQMGNAPVNIVVSYGRDFSEEGWANVQSASALIQNMSLAAHVLGLGTFWITQMGDREKVRELVGLPYDRLVIAVIAVGFPKFAAKGGPKRRPLSVVAHYNHYAGKPIPSSTDPAHWSRDDLATYQRARVLNGLRHNKPRPWETRALLAMLERFVPDGRAELAAGDANAKRWLDVLPCTGILTERMSRERRGWRFDAVERTQDVCDFVAERTSPRAGTFLWPVPESAQGQGEPVPEAYDLVTCLFRVENLPPRDRPALFRALARWVKPGGSVIVGFVNRRSFHDWTEKLRARRGGPRGVEYVLSPDPNIGPFESLAPTEVEALAREAGLAVVERIGLQAVPQTEEIEFRARNFGARARSIANFAGGALGLVDRLGFVRSRWGRFQFVKLTRPSSR